MTAKNVIIIGAGAIGVTAFNSLHSSLPASHRVILIESSAFALWPIGALRAATVPGWEEKVLADYPEAWSKGAGKAGSKGIVLKGTKVVEVRKGEIVIDEAKPSQGIDSEVIPYEYLVVATGSHYAAPCRIPEYIKSIAEMKEYFRGLQRDIKSAEKVLIVGGGPVGVEFAGEVLAQYPKKSVTLVTSNPTLIGNPPQWKSSFPAGLAKQMAKAGGKIIYGQKVELQGVETGKVEGGPRTFQTDQGENIEADFVLVATGNRPNTSLLSSLAPSSYHASGRLHVTPTLQLSTAPKPSAPAEGLENIFVIGDAAEVGDVKMFATGSNHAPIASANIVSSIKSGKQKSYKAPSSMMLVTFGPKGGQGQLMGMLVGPFFASKLKGGSLFVNVFNQAHLKK